MICDTFFVLCCRCEAFNSLMREQNIFSNRRAPSRDIAVSFLTLEALRFVCSSGEWEKWGVSYNYGSWFTLMQHAVQTVLNGVSVWSTKKGKTVHAWIKLSLSAI